MLGSLLLKKRVFIVTASAVSIVLAVISWHLYEKQFFKLKHFFPYQPNETAGAPRRRLEVATACSQPPLATYD